MVDNMTSMVCETAEMYGWHSLSDIDLFSIVTGDKTSAQILCDYFSNSSCSVDGIMNLNIDGIGKSSAMKIKALYTLFTRSKSKDVKVIKSSLDAYECIKEKFQGLDHEQMWVVYLNRNCEVIKKTCHSIGGSYQTVIDNKLLVRDALNMKGCYSLIIAHNHPSGSIQPSEADRNMTNLLKKACEYFQLYLFDSIIVGDGKYYSFCDDCKL